MGTFFRVLLLLVLSGGGVTAVADTVAKVKIVTTIKPLSLIVSDIGGSYVEIEQLVPANSSPHDFALRISDRVKLDEADLVLWIGQSLDPFVDKMVSSQQVSLAADQLKGVSWPVEDEQHDHHHDHQHSHHDGCTHGSGGDPHIWLNPDNAVVIASELAARLADIDPTNADKYRQASERFTAEMNEFDRRAARQLSVLPLGQFVVQHDAYGHFINRYQLQQLGSLRSVSGAKAGARTLARLLKQGQGGLACVVSDPQFDPRPARVFAERTGVKLIELDPLGHNVESGASGYQRFLQGFVDAFAECLE